MREMQLTACFMDVCGRNVAITFIFRMGQGQISNIPFYTTYATSHLMAIPAMSFTVCEILTVEMSIVRDLDLDFQSVPTSNLNMSIQSP